MTASSEPRPDNDVRAASNPLATTLGSEPASASASASAFASGRPLPADEIAYATTRRLAELIATKQLSARELLQLHLDRIERLNPLVNAIVSLDERRARAEAAAADEQLARGEHIGPLHGLPAAFKDTHATAGLRTTSGSPLFSEHVPAEDDLVVARMRAAGVITVGKTNVPEFAAGSHTFNPVFGVTRNPYDLSRSAGGSSGGAAAALAAGLVPIAEGSDLGGSLRNPASFCNVVGFRPSSGRVPDWPRAFYSDTMGVSGPMGRTVDDVALLLSAIAGPDSRVPGALPEAGTSFAGPFEGELRGVRVAWSADLGGRVTVDPAVRQVVGVAADAFAALGWQVEQACIDFTGAEEAFRTLRAWTFAASYGELMDAHPDQLKASVRWNVEAGRVLSGEDVARADQHRMQLFRRTQQFFDDYDVLALPACQVPPFDADDEYPTEIDGRAQHTYLDWMRAAYFVSVTGAPALSVPAGFTADGLPVGIQLVAAPGADLQLLRIGHAFEQATRVGNRRPAFRGTPAQGPTTR